MGTLSTFLRDRVGVVVLILVGLGTQLVAIFLGHLACVCFVGVLGTVFGLFWIGSGTGQELARKAARGLLAVGGVVLAVGAAEILVRVLVTADLLVLPPRSDAARPRKGDDVPGVHSVCGVGFRSRHLTESISPDTFRIVTLGDSFTWGHGVPDLSRVWPYAVQELLDARGIRTSVVNLAQCGFTTVNEVEVLERFGFGFRPHLVVLQYLANDPLPSGPGLWREGEDWMRVKGPPPVFSPKFGKLLGERSCLYSLGSEAYRKGFVWATGRKDLTYFDLHEDGFPGWHDTEAAFVRLSTECRRRGIPVLVVIFPVLGIRSDLAESYVYQSIHEKVCRAAAACGLVCVDLRPAFGRVRANPRSWWAGDGDAHPSAEGHRLAATTICEELDARNLLPGR
jgi:hypothetical protein